MPSIEIDFEVFKALTVRRARETVTYNDVIRELLELPSVVAAIGGQGQSGANGGGDWISKGVRFPAGTEFRATYKGGVHYGKVERGRMIVGGKLVTSPSDAARQITGNSVNGWSFWECRFPGDDRWRQLKTLQHDH